MRTFGPSIQSIEGAEEGSGRASSTTPLRVDFGPSDDRYTETTVTIQLSSPTSHQ
jgi:hypothetical protein